MHSQSYSSAKETAAIGNGTDMKIGTIAWVVLALLVGLFGGWLGKAYVSSRVESARSLLELSQAHEVMRSGDIQRAIFHAAQAAALNPKAYLVFLSLAEFYERAGHQGLAVVEL